MTNQRVSDLSDGGAIQDTDEFYAQRGTDQVKIAGSALGGSLPSHTGTPVGNVTPAGGVGSLIVDSTNGCLYIAIGPTNADWLAVGGRANDSPPGLSGTGNAGPFGPKLMATAGDTAYIGDVDADQNNGDGYSWYGLADGLGYAKIQVGGGDHNLQIGPGNALTFDGSPVGGSQTLTDLGVVEITDLLAGQVALYTPSSEYVSAVPDVDSAVAPDHHTISIVQREPSDAGDPRSFFSYGGTFQGPAGAGHGFYPFVSSTVVYAGLVTDFSAYFLDEALAAWQANHVYSDKTCISAAGHIWSSDTGTSGGSAPDFAGNLGGTVTDNTVTWQDEGALPTTGSVHVYALVVGT